MKRHTKIYMDHFNYGIEDFIPCEICNSRAVDVHHIIPRGIGGSKNRDNIENLMALCREHHEQCESGEISREDQQRIHLKKLQQ